MFFFEFSVIYIGENYKNTNRQRNKKGYVHIKNSFTFSTTFLSKIGQKKFKFYIELMENYGRQFIKRRRIKEYGQFYIKTNMLTLLSYPPP